MISDIANTLGSTRDRSGALPNTSIHPVAFLKLIIPLILIGLSIYFFHIELDIRLIGIMPIVIGGFAIHSFLPATWRLPFLFLLTLAAIFRLLDWSDGLILIGLGLTLFAIANLPVRAIWRIIIMLGLTAILVAFRAQWLPFYNEHIILPILGTMFMFRMILFLYEMQFEKQSAGIWTKLNYFFLLPNLVFVIFPVVDYITFTRTYYSKPAYDTYRRGLLMMANGLLHLFLYRIIYYYLLPPPSSVTTVFDLLQFIVATYALIVRLAGIFHFSAGVICLFGFYLPPTFDHYFFANSFNDIWRRINIYWRDFVVKVFYFPIYFRLKKYGTASMLFISTLIVFVINWFLHASQWFWIRGSFLISAQDIIFWAIFGVAVGINSVMQSRKRPGGRRPGTWSAHYAMITSLQVIAIFFTMTVLWSFWTSYTIDDWFVLFSVIRDVQLQDIGILVLGFIGLVLAGIGLQYVRFRMARLGTPQAKKDERNLVLTTLLLLVMALAGSPPVNSRIASVVQMDIEPIMTTKLNEYDKEQQFKGYYETLLVNNNMNSRLWEIQQEKPDDWKQFSSLGVAKRRDDIVLKELLPNQKTEFKGAILQTNNLGLRDQDYEAVKPPRTLRIALLGGSIEMGVGVNNGETYEQLVEDELNREKLFGDSITVEILNFAISGNHLFQNIGMYEVKATGLQPDAVIYTAHSNEAYRVLNSIHKAYVSGRYMIYDFLYDLMEEGGYSRATPEAQFMKEMMPRKEEVALWGYQHLLDTIQRNQQIPIWAFIPTLDENEVEGEEAFFENELKMRGYYTLNLEQAYTGKAKDHLKIALWDTHPNKDGHQLLAREFVRQLKNNPSLIRALKEKAGQS